MFDAAKIIEWCAGLGQKLEEIDFFYFLATKFCGIIDNGYQIQ